MEDEKAESRNYTCVACDGYPVSYNSPCVVCGRVMETAVDAKDAEIARLKAENERLRDALGTHGRHFGRCAFSGHNDCDCGLNKALRGESD
jgi:hypothetical protein